MPRATDPSRRRRIRLIVALTAALLLAAALAYTTFTAASDAVSPSQLLASSATAGRSYQLTGKVKPGTVHRTGNLLRFQVWDRAAHGPAVPVVYRGTVPDPFRDGREIIVSGHMRGGRFVGTKDSLITKCPSKFTTNTPSGRTT